MLRRALAPLLFACLCLHAWPAESVHSRTIAPGVTSTVIRRDAGPFELGVIRVQRNEPLVHLDAAVGGGTVHGFAPVSRITGSLVRDGYPVAAVNGDFYAMSGPTAGLTRGPSIAGGELVSSGPDRDSFYVLPDGTPGIGRLEVRTILDTPAGEVPVEVVNRSRPDDGLVLYTGRWGWPVHGPAVVIKAEGLPLRSHGQWSGSVIGELDEGAAHDVGSGELVVAGSGRGAERLARVTAGQAVRIDIATEGVSGPVAAAVGGGPVLIRDGSIVINEPAAGPVHPRTAVGFSNTEVVLVTVDGRQPGWSVGMSLGALAGLMAEMGCTEAINLDGGGSTTAWVRGEVTNRPSDGRERSVANALLVLSSAPTGPPARMEFEPTVIVAMSGGRVPVQVRVLDQWYNLITVAGDELGLTVRPDGAWAELQDGTLVLTGPPAVGALGVFHAQHPAAHAEIPMRIVDSVARVGVEPQEAVLAQGDELRLRASGFTEDGEPVWLADESVAWSVDGDGFSSLGGGVFRALEAGAHAHATARLGEAAGNADLYTAENRMIVDFEGDRTEVRASCWPTDGSVSGSVSVLPHGKEAAGSFCRLRFDLGAPQGTRAAYLVLDRKLGRALSVSLLARTQATAPPWVRAQIIDGNGTTHRFTLSSGPAPDQDWHALRTRLPDGLKPPLTWQSVYAVATAGRTSAGHLDVDDLQATCLAE